MAGFDIVGKDASRVSAIDKDCINKWSWTWICKKLNGDGTWCGKLEEAVAFWQVLPPLPCGDQIYEFGRIRALKDHV